jgi:hypothetical protein
MDTKVLGLIEVTALGRGGGGGLCAILRFKNCEAGKSITYEHMNEVLIFCKKTDKNKTNNFSGFLVRKRIMPP